MGSIRRHLLPDETQADRDFPHVRVHWQQRFLATKQQHTRRCFRTNPFQATEPRGALLRREIRRKSSLSSPRSSVIRRINACRRGALTSGKLTFAIVSCTSLVGASRTASHEPNRRKRLSYAAAVCSSRVRCERMISTSILIGSLLEKGSTPYFSVSRNVTSMAFADKASTSGEGYP